MEEKLIKVLIDEYKERGLDVSAVVDNPMFKDLKLETKIELLKKFASHISSNTSKSLTKKEISSIIADTAWSGLMAGGLTYLASKPAAKLFAGAKVPASIVAVPVLTAAALTAAGSLMSAKKYVSNRESMAKKFSTLAKDPTDENALKVLINRQGQLNTLVGGGSMTSNSANNIKNLVHDLPSTYMSFAAPDAAFKTMHKYYSSHVEPAEDITEDHVGDRYSEAGDARQNAIKSLFKNVLGGH